MVVDCKGFWSSERERVLLRILGRTPRVWGEEEEGGNSNDAFGIFLEHQVIWSQHPLHRTRFPTKKSFLFFIIRKETQLKRDYHTTIYSIISKIYKESPLDTKNPSLPILLQRKELVEGVIMHSISICYR